MTGYASRPAVIAWVFFDWAAQPFFTLITTFIYGPFFVSVLAPDPVEGQALWGYATALSGILIALCSPLLGGIADRFGPRKPWIAGFGALLIIGSAMLWYARPGSQWAMVIALSGFVIGTLGAEFATIFNNAMMTRLVPRERLGRLSGTGWAVGYVGGLVSLALVLAWLAADASTGKTLIGVSPAFELDPARHEGERLSGPLTACWFALFIAPMFLLTPDTARGKMSLRDAAGGSVAHLRVSLAALKHLPGLGPFLLANMVYQDGLVALFAFGGVYGAGVFGWSTIELGLFGILLTVTGAIGAWLGGKVDDAIGSANVIRIAIGCLLVACVGILSLAPDRIGFVIAATPAALGDGPFGSLPERFYLGFGVLIGVVAGPLQASSRSLLVRLAPAHQSAQFFGLFALSGKVTSFTGPMLVAVATSAFSSQRAGLAVLIGFFLAGAWLIGKVNVAEKTEH